jgi:hypothetical protein
MGSFSTTLPSLMGLGVVTTSQEIGAGVQTAGAAAGATAAIVGATSVIPIIGPIVAGVTAIIAAFGIGNGCGGTCTEATQVVNQAEPALQQNLSAAQQAVAANGCLTSAEQAQLIQNFNTVWQQVLTQCGQIPAPGGTQCISDRQQGSTKINGTNWFNMYLVPIQQMPVCAASASSAVAAGTVISDVVSSLTANPLLLAAIAVGAFLLLKD